MGKLPQREAGLDVSLAMSGGMIAFLPASEDEDEQVEQEEGGDSGNQLLPLDSASFQQMFSFFLVNTNRSVEPILAVKSD